MPPRAEEERADLLMVLRGLFLVAGVMLLTGYAGAAATPIRQLTDTSASNLRPAWSPDGQRIAFQSNREGPYQIYVMEADGSDVQRITTGDVDDRHPAWSPDGRLLAVDSGDAQRREIWVIDVASRERTQLTRLDAIASFPSWSPDGRRIGFYVYRGGTMDVWTMAADGNAASQLTQDLASERNRECTFACHTVAWSPDGQRVAFADGRNERVLLMAALAGSVPTSISPEGERSHFPTYLADGRLVYVSEHISLEESYTDVWAVDPDAAGERDPIAQRVRAQGPFALSADARELLFASPRSGNFEIYAVTLDEAGKAALAERPARAGDAPSTGTTPVGLEPAASGLELPEGWPFLAALAALALIMAGIELGFRRRRARR